MNSSLVTLLIHPWKLSVHLHPGYEQVYKRPITAWWTTTIGIVIILTVLLECNIHHGTWLWNHMKYHISVWHHDYCFVNNTTVIDLSFLQKNGSGWYWRGIIFSTAVSVLMTHTTYISLFVSWSPIYTLIFVFSDYVNCGILLCLLSNQTEILNKCSWNWMLVLHFQWKKCALYFLQFHLDIKKCTFLQVPQIVKKTRNVF